MTLAIGAFHPSVSIDLFVQSTGPAPKGPDPRSWREAGWQPTVFPFTGNPGPQGLAAELDSEEPVDFMEVGILCIFFI